MKLRTRAPLVVVVALLLTACAGSEDPTTPAGEGDGAADDPRGSWELVAAESTIDVPDDGRVTLEVTRDGDDWQAGGTSACNSYGGSVVVDGDTWGMQDLAGTDMACDEPRMATERAYLDALRAVDTWGRPSEEELILSGDEVELHFAALPPVPTAELTSTTWVLDGLIDGSGPDGSVSSTVAGADEATLRLEPDGTVHASTGCRTFDGEWVESGDEVLFTTFGESEDSPNVASEGIPTCDEAVVEQERHVLSVLGDGFRAEVEGQDLRLYSNDGLGLSYHAAADEAASEPAGG